MSVRTSTTDSDVRPAPVRHRIVGVDVARALALFGMMATHLLEPLRGLEVTWHQQLAGGRSAALFAVLAGVSLSLMTGGHHPLRGADLTDARAGIFARAMVIGVVGLLLGPLDTFVMVILAYYGLLFALGIPFLHLGWRALAVLAGCWAMLAPAASHLVRANLPSDRGPEVNVNPTLGMLVEDPVSLLGQLGVTGFYPVLTWMAYLLAGLAIGRCDLRAWATAVRLALVGAALAAGSWAASWLLLDRLGGLERLHSAGPGSGVALDVRLALGLDGTTPTTSWWWLAVSSPHSGSPVDLLHTIGCAMAVLGVCLLAGRAAPSVLGFAFAAGTMTLSVYAGHVVALALEVGPPRPTVDLFVVHLAVVVVAAAVCRRFVGSGPLERVTTGVARATARRQRPAAEPG